MNTEALELLVREIAASGKEKIDAAVAKELERLRSAIDAILCTGTEKEQRCDRKDKNESPPEFIKRVHGEEMRRGLTR